MRKDKVGAELLSEEICHIAGGLNPQPLPPMEEIASWAVGTSGTFQKIMVLKLEILGNPIINGLRY
jgi:hypothetical protein